ncbi:GNAT family N-acetyltransferase [Sphaerisporangium corydalis]|uniref:GNAT family N-acetyltransferase n=1 Tax=Sphaerisporangium corydalis TaxID=1441875 RepID=A0ABV9EAM8_9ACTN|nr:GNAT family N-acetyltransferase [Sphaerisporangium corydalis]
MSSRIDLVWPSEADDVLRDQVHQVLHAVVAAGGAVGYLRPPGGPETDKFLDGVLTAVRHGHAALALARVDGVVRAMGLWKREPEPIFQHSARVGKIMAHPSARGLGLGRLVVGALVENARAAGIETLTLGVRGNNHGAIELYEELGFREWGRLPNVIEVGDERFDDVRMLLTLGRAPTVVLRGSQTGGAGSSPRRARGRTSSGRPG